MPFKNAEIYYFSGTGNAKHCAYWSAEQLNQNNIPAQIYNIAEQKIVAKEKIQKDTLISICGPTHGFNYPPILMHYIFRFPRTRFKNKVILFNTRAGFRVFRLNFFGISGISMLLAAFILFLKGYRVVGLRPVDLPSNWISLHPGVSKRMISAMFEIWEKKVKLSTQKIVDGKKAYRGLWYLPVDLVLIPISFVYYLFGRWFFAKTFYASHACNNCGLCLQQCPVHAIKKIDNRMYWKFTCESCMQCMNRCPEKAIQTMHGITIGAWYLIFTFLFYYISVLLYALVPSASESFLWNEIILTLIQFSFPLVLIFLLYRILHFLLRYKWFSKLMCFTSFTWFWWWRRYKSPILNKTKK